MSRGPQSPVAGAKTMNPYGMRTSPVYSLVSHSTCPSNIVTTAGQIGALADGSVVSDPVRQIRQAFKNLSRCLEAVGARKQDILKLTYYIVDYDHKNPRQRNVVLEWLGDCRPPTTLIPVTKLALPEFLFEVEAIAAVPQLPFEKVDVVVVGAGLSGLQAAVDLQRQGLTVKVLEARDRIGGKTWSRRVASTSSSGVEAVCDVGAAWINDTNQSKMFALAQQFGLETIVQNTRGKIIVDNGIGNLKTHPYGELLADANDKDRIEDIIRVRSIFEADCQKIDINDIVTSGSHLGKDLDNMTFEEYIRSHARTEDAFNALAVGARAMLGVEPRDMSALYFLNYCKSGGGYLSMRSDKRDGGQYLRIRQGAQSFSMGLAEQLEPGSIVLMAPVRNISMQQDTSVHVTCARGTFEASRVIVSIPTPLYKDLSFDPPLPPEKLQLAEATTLGDYCKMIALYQRPWWREADLCGLAQSSHGPFAVTRDSSIDQDGHYSLTCFIVGQPARDWSALDAEARRASVLAQIDRLFGPFVQVEQPIHIEEQIWKDEQWSQGCPCPVLGPGGLARFEKVMRAPVGPVHFVGTETSDVWKGYMEGAVRSGERGAQEVMQSLKA